MINSPVLSILYLQVLVKVLLIHQIIWIPLNECGYVYLHDDRLFLTAATLCYKSAAALQLLKYI